LANFRETKVEESEQTSLTNQAGGELGTEDPYVVDKMGTLIKAPPSFPQVQSIYNS